MKNIFLHFNFGYSFYTGASVLSLITNRLPATFSLAVGAAIIWLLMGIPIGILSAIRSGSFMDRGAMGVALVFVSMPVFWLGLVVLFLFSDDIGRFHLLPGANTYTGLTVNPWHWFTSLLMPWFVLAATSAAVYSRVLRGSLIEAMGEDYIRTARAKGLPERRVIWRHGVRSAITPVVTIFGLDLGALLGGAVITETVFNIPGIGRLNLDAINHSDFPIVQGRSSWPRCSSSSPTSWWTSSAPISTRASGTRDDRDRDRGRPHRRGPASHSCPSRTCASFHTDDGVVHAVDGISYALEAGKTLGIVGESGSGKTVSSLTMLGLTRSGALNRGYIMFQGGTWSRWRTTSCADARQRRLDDLSDPLSALQSILRVGAAGGGDAGAPQPRVRAQACAICCGSSVSRIRRRGSTSIRTSSRAACASAR